jgi:ISXO2-like transposase domain
MSEMIQYRASRIDVHEMEDGGAMLLARTDKGQLVEGYEVRQGAGRKNAVLTLVERDGSARSFGAETAKKQDVLPIVRANIARENYLTTGESVQYAKLCDEFAKHGSVDHHRSEYGRPDNQHQDREWALRHPRARYDRCISTLRRATFAPLARGI